jgi:hypothetical protein
MPRAEAPLFQAGNLQKRVDRPVAGFYPPFIEIRNEFHSINFYILLGLSTVLFLVKAPQPPSRWDQSGLGRAHGILLLFRAETVMLCAAIAALLFSNCERRTRVTRSVLFVAVAYGCLTPWTIRNNQLFHHLVPTTTASGVALYIGNNPHATGSDRNANGYVLSTVPPQMQVELEAVPMVPDKEVLLHRIFRRWTMAYIVSHPWRVVMLAWQKLRIFWSFDPYHAKGAQLVFWLPSVTPSVLAGLGLVVGMKPPIRALSPMLISIGFAMLTRVVFFALPRYKLVIDPFLCVLASNAVMALPRQARRFAGSYRAP